MINTKNGINAMFDFSNLTNVCSDLSGDMSSTLSLLDSYGEAGLVLAPNEPTETMVTAGAKVAGISSDQIRRIYQVMISSQD